MFCYSVPGVTSIVWKLRTRTCVWPGPERETHRVLSFRHLTPDPSPWVWVLCARGGGSVLLPVPRAASSLGMGSMSSSKIPSAVAPDSPTQEKGSWQLLRGAGAARGDPSLLLVAGGRSGTCAGSRF